ncbi:hypothetical protein JRQ81_012389 [Phrynocephalus forsythii]|uniref:Protein FAM217A n=1 Tax=Phrynocephalus forsythii TaxID=171643 RepID=A0A9Q0Y247_9SAUR|nr:hypothetical protein JRQ81_012389 [Phrynocephalus forsythii]
MKERARKERLASSRKAPSRAPPSHGGARAYRRRGLIKGNKTTKSANLVEKKDNVSGICGTGLPLNSFFHQTSHTCGLESDCSVKKTFHSPEDRITSGGVFANAFYKDHYKAAMEQLAALSLSSNTQATELNSSIKQGPFYSWSCINHQGSNSVSRDFKKPSTEVASGSSDMPIHANNNPLVHSFIKRCHPLSCTGAEKNMEQNYCRNGEGDFSKKSNEVCAADSYPATDSSSDDMSSVLKWNLKKGNSNVDDRFSAEEKDICESEKKKKALLNYLKNVNLNLKPEPIEEHKEGTSSSVDSSTFSYPDFLPVPYNTLDLQKLSKYDDWRACLNVPVGASLDKLISRLVEMERLQHLTVLKEGTKETFSPTMAGNNRVGLSKDVHQLKQLKLADLSCPQAAFDGDPRFGCCMHEPRISKYTCQHCHSKWNSGASSPVHTSTRYCLASCSTSRYSKASITLDSSNVDTRRSLSCSGSSPKTRPGIKITSQKSLSSSTAVACSVADNESTKSKQPRTRRRSCRKNGALMSKPVHSQKLKSLSLTSKQNCSNIDHQ